MRWLSTPCDNILANGAIEAGIRSWLLLHYRRGAACPSGKRAPDQQDDSALPVGGSRYEPLA